MKPSTGKLTVRAVSVVLVIFLLSPLLTVSAQAPVRVIFLHHSTGHNLIEQGGLRELLTGMGYEFFDHGYNGDGLRLADGEYTGSNYDIPGDNTDPDGLAELFSQPFHQPADNAFSHLMEYDVILLKSCFPVSNIWDDARLAELQGYYLTIRERMDQHPEKLFIILTQPPQVPADSNRDESARARQLAAWLASDEYLGGRANIKTFNFFDLLAGSDNFLKSGYRSGVHDAHPNERANREIAPILADFVDASIKAFQPGEASEPGTVSGGEADEQPVEEAQSTPQPATFMQGGIIDGFEVDTGRYVPSSDAVNCALVNQPVYGGQSALELNLNLTSGGSAACSTWYDESQNWASGDGVRLYYHATDVQGALSITLHSGDSGATTPFAGQIPILNDGTWHALDLPWGIFTKASWADSGGLEQVDPARITGFDVEVFTDGGSTGILVVDELQMINGDLPAPELPGPAVDEQPPAGEQLPPAEPQQPDIAPGLPTCPGALLLLPLAVGVWAWRQGLGK